MAFTRKQSREKQKYTYVKSEYAASEADSTVAHWAPPASQAPKRRARRTEACNQHGTDWQNLPDGPLLRIFEVLFADKAAAEDLHNAAATCTQWREAFLEVTLGDTAASRPERPPLQDDNVKKEAPATTATACAAVCEPSKSETNGFEACSIRRQTAVGATVPAAPPPSSPPLAIDRDYVGQDRRHAALGPLAAALAADAFAAAAADAEGAHNEMSGPPEATGQRHQQWHRGQGRTAQHADLADLSPAEQLQRREHVVAAADGPVGQDVVDLPADCRRLPTAGAAADRARRRSGSSMGTQLQVALAAAAAAAAEEVHGPLAAAAHHGRSRGGLGRRRAATQQQSEQDDQNLQPVAACRHLQQHAAAAAAAGDVSEDGGALTDEVVQPTTAEGGDVPAATGRRRRHRLSARTSSAAAAAAGPAAAAGAGTGERGQAGHLLAAASTPRPRSRRLQHRSEGPQQHQQQHQEQAEADGQPGPQRLQLPADSTEAVAQGEPVSGGAAGNGSQSRQNSGSNRPAGESNWFGGLFHIPAWLRRGGSS